jgi:putative colanic acid biosynthesis glycosyltransferase
VSYKDIEGLRKTLNSLEPIAHNCGREIEILVQDGGTGDGLDAIRSQFGEWAQFVSAPDTGIYDAMNRGLDRSKGDFVWFLNGGDESLIIDWVSIRDLLVPRVGSILFAPYRLKLRNAAVARRARGGDYIWHGLPTSHQAILYPGDAARSRRYDLRYRVAGDYAFTASLLRSGIPWERFPIELAAFQSGGMSQQNSRTIAAEANRVQREILQSSSLSRWRSSLRHRLSRWARAVSG